MKVLSLILAGTAFLPGHVMLAQVQQTSCLAEHYKLVALPIHPTQINDAGQVSGTTPSRRAALWSQPGGLKRAEVLLGFSIAEGVGVNAAGDLIGVAANADGSKRQAFTFIHGKTVLLPGQQSKASMANDQGEIAGESSIAGKTASSPVIWRKRAMVDLGACCGGTAFALNSKGQVVGQSYDADGRYHAFLWDAVNGMKTIPMAEEYSSAVAINDAGHAVIQAFPHNYFYEDGKLTPLELSPRYPSQPRALNNCDVIVGSFGKHSDDSKAFIWEKVHGFIDLNERVLVRSGWKLEVASGINNRGEIVGWGDFKGDEDQGFLLLPQW